MELTRTPDVEVPSRTFVPEEFDPADVDGLKGLVGKLAEREPGTVAELKSWIYDWSELASVVWGQHSRNTTAMNRDTTSTEFRDRHLRYQKNVLPLYGVLENQLEGKLLASSCVADLPSAFDEFLNSTRKSHKLFREENTKLSAESSVLGAKYQEIQGSTTVDLRGETLTVQQAGAKLVDPDRKFREEAFRAIASARAEHIDAVDDVYDGQIKLRQQMAKNAGFDSYRDFRFAELQRTDYTPADCEAFHAAIGEVVIPALRECQEYRRGELGLETLRPWDMEVSIFGSDPTPIFSTQEEYVALVQKIFRSIDPIFERDFDVLVRNELLDLMSRPGKSPGGYNCGVEDMRLPFIFFNAVGRREDLRVMLHEGGHAFHTLATRGLPLVWYRHAPIEFCEVASMSMELFGTERLGQVMTKEQAREIEYKQMEGMLNIFAAVAKVDAFQHWIYTADNPDVTARGEKWVELGDKYGTGVIDYTGLEEMRKSEWQRIPHLFGQPFYFVEYAIAQLGALQMWRKEKLDHDGTVVSYREALALGGGRPLKELFHAAGIRFAMDREVLEELIPSVIEKLRALR